MNLDTLLRSMIRDEVARQLAGTPSLTAPCPVAAFVGALAPGEEVGASELHGRYLTQLGPAEAPPSRNAFGRRVRASGLCARRETAQGTLWRRLGSVAG